MTELSKNALEICKKRYFIDDNETWEGLSKRVAKAVSINEKDKKWTDIFAEEINEMNFIPGGRILRNCGKLKQSILNCACLPISDSIEAIGDTIKNSLILWSYGAGIGIDFSPLRPIGFPLVSKGGYSSGMVSFIKAIDAVASTIETGGQRRCLPGKSLIFTEKGLIKISNIEIGDKVYTIDGIKKVTNTFRQGEQKVYKINTNAGDYYYTKNHSVAILSNDNTYIWKKVENLTKDDILIGFNKEVEGEHLELPNDFTKDRPEKSTTCGYMELPKLTPEIAWLIGLVHGDGYVGDRNKLDYLTGASKVSISIHIKDYKIISKTTKALEKFKVKVVVKKKKNENCVEVIVRNQRLVEYFWKYIKQPKISIEIPDFILKNTKDIRAAYLAGLIDSDGSLNNKPPVAVVSIYKDFTEQIQSLYFSLGIPTRLKTINRKEENWKTLYQICIIGFRKFYNKTVGFYSCKGNVNKLEKNKNGYKIPKSIALSQLRDRDYRGIWAASSDTMTYEIFLDCGGETIGIPININSISYEGKLNTYDLEVEEDSCFYADGILTHNSGCLGLCKVSHPEIYDFLRAKIKDKDLSYFNLSVGIDKNFIYAVEEDKDWELKFAGKKVRTVKARDLWNEILEAMISSAEPGLINLDNLKKNNSYSFQPISCTNLCFSKETIIHTRQGHFPIKDLVGKSVDIWDGTSWITIDNFRVTGKNKKMLKISLYDGSTIRTTDYHKFYLEDMTEIEASKLEIGDFLAKTNCEKTYGNLNEKSAYFKGFLLGDGSLKAERKHPILNLYSTKYSCEERLSISAKETEIECNNTNTNEDIGFLEEKNNRKSMTGLTARKYEFYSWVGEYRKGLPCYVYNWNYSSICEFIAGYLDADGASFDSKGYGYQVWANSKKLLQDIQLLLKIIGVYSKISDGKKAEKKNFNDGYSDYSCKKSYRLTISQKNSIKLSKMVRFERLKSFSDKEVKYNIKNKFNKIVSIEYDGVDDKVYCCTVPKSHKVSLSLGILSGQCGEIPLPSMGTCCLGSLVLPNFLSGKQTNWKKLKNSINIAIRFLDNVLDVNFYPIKQMEIVTFEGRRLGMGVMGLHNYLIKKEIRYGSEKSIIEVERLFKFIRDAAYMASVELAKEKGAFPKYSRTDFNRASFVKKLPAKIRLAIKENGIRNVCLISCQPTGTTSLIPEVSSGIEPIFSLAYKRKDRVSERIYIQEDLLDILKENKEIPYWLIDSSDLSPEHHLEIQSVCQRFVDNAVSKTINCSKGITKEELSELLLENVKDLKGITIYVDGTREGQVMERLSMEEAKKYIKQSTQDMSEDELQCARGTCEI